MMLGPTEACILHYGYNHTWPRLREADGKNPVETRDQVVLNTNNMQIADACCLAAPSFAPFSSQENFLYG